MATDIATTNTLVSLLTASLASVRAALAQTRDVLCDAAPKLTDVGNLSPRLDTLQAFYEPSFSAAISRRRQLFGGYDG